MPAMPRFKGKSTKIAYSILGKPANMDNKQSKAQRELNQKLERRNPLPSY